MEAKQVLIIEDDALLQELLEKILATNGFRVCKAYDGEQGLRACALQPFDLVLLDIMLPKTSGWEVLRQLRRRSDMPIIIISALFREEYVTHAAHYGADFLQKPFSRTALLAAIEAVLPWATQPPDKAKSPQAINRQPVPLAEHLGQLGGAAPKRQTEHLAERHALAHLQIDLTTRQVLVQGQRVKLTATEYRLLEHLVKHAGQVLTYQQILEAVWGWEYGNSTHYVHVFVSQLRQKLEANSDEPRYLLTERGVGYCFAW